MSKSTLSSTKALDLAAKKPSTKDEAKAHALSLLRTCTFNSRIDNIPVCCRNFERVAKLLVSNGHLPSSFSPSKDWQDTVSGLTPAEQVNYAVKLAKSINGSHAPNIESVAVANAIGLLVAGKSPDAIIHGHRAGSLAGIAKTLISEAAWNIDHYLFPKDLTAATPVKTFYNKQLKAPVFTGEDKENVFANVKVAFKDFFKNYSCMEDKVSLIVCRMAELFASKGYLAFDLFHDDILLSRHFATETVSGRKLALLQVPGQITSRMIIDVTNAKNPDFLDLDKIDKSGAFLDRFRPSSNGRSDIFQPVQAYLKEKAEYEKNARKN